MGDIQAVVRRFRKQILELEAEVASAIEHHYRAMLPKIQADIDLFTRRMEAAMSDDGNGLPASWLYEQHRLKHLQQIIKDGVDGFARVAHGEVYNHLYAAANSGASAGHALLEATVPRGIRYTFGQPSPRAIHAQIATLQSDSPLQKLFQGWGKDAADRAGKTLVYGVTSGRNPRDVARDLAGELGIPRNRALTISRTEMLRAYREASMQTFRENSDVCTGWRWTCFYSDRSCAACIEMDGTIHPLDEDLSSHVCCRCVASPLTRSYASILSDVGIDGSDIDEVNSPTTWQTGHDWFEEQDDATKRQILGGNAKFNAYQAGDLNLKDLLGTTNSAEWGKSIYVKSLKELGLDASDYAA